MIRDNWHQPTPGMQFTAILNNLDGSFSNWEDGFTSVEVHNNRMREIINELQELRPFLQKSSWPAEHTQKLIKSGYVSAEFFNIEVTHE